jgi:hypothetical protein
MRLFLIILALFSSNLFAETGEGSADLSSHDESGFAEWARKSDDFTKSRNKSKVQSIVNDVLNENPKSTAESKSSPVGDSVR